MNNNPYLNSTTSEQQQNILYTPQPHLQLSLSLPSEITAQQTLPEPHLMPEPTSAPWDVNAMPWKAANSTAVMHFSGNPNIDSVHRRAMLHQKRKSDQMPPMPAKQFITEEIITKHFNGLHISSSFIQNTNSSGGFATVDAINDSNMPSTSGKCFTNLTYRDYQITAKELEEKLKKANRITMCEEIKKFHEDQRKASFIPNALLNRVEKPCTALVLWQPPPILSLIQLKDTDEKRKASSRSMEMTMGEIDDIIDGDAECEEEIDDFIDNNNTSSMDFNNLKADGMDEDL